MGIIYHIQRLLSKLELQHFVYWAALGVALLITGIIGLRSILPTLNATGSLLLYLNIFHWVLIGSGILIILMFVLSIVLYIQVA
ncbi:MAG: hypothetical protein ACTSU2_06800 [Promethearchaeota archaeon]